MAETILSHRRKELKRRRYEAALEKTNKAAQCLYESGAQAVYIFGSLLHSEKFDEMSDVDIYIVGMPIENRKGIFGKVEKIFGEIRFDLLFDDDDLRPEIKEKIFKEGKRWKH